MEALDGDFFIPFRVVMETEGDGALSNLLERYAPGRAVIIGDQPALDRGGVAALAHDLKSQRLSPTLTLTAPRPPLTPEAAARGSGQLRSLRPAIAIALGGAGAMEYAALTSLTGPQRDPDRSPRCPTVLIPTTPLAAFTAVLPVYGTWDPLQDEIRLAAPAAPYPSVVWLDTRQCLNTVRSHPTDPGMAPLGLALEALLNGHGDPFADALATEAVRRLVPGILPAAGGTEDGLCWKNLLTGGLLAGMAYGRCGTAWGWSLTWALRNVYRLDPGSVAGMLLPEIVRAGEDSAARRAIPLARLWSAWQPNPLAAGRKVLAYALKYTRSPFSPPLEAGLDLLRQTAPEALRGLGRYARQKANLKLDNLTLEKFGLEKLGLDNLELLDRWSGRQALMALTAEIRTLNRRTAFLMDRPLNLRRAGVDDKLAKLGRVAAVAQSINERMAPQAPLDQRSLEEWVYAVYRTRQTPLEADPRDLEPRGW